MTSIKTLLRGGAALLAIATLAGCSQDKDLLGLPTTKEAQLLNTYVALGNSITAGYQSGGITAAMQQQAYPVLFAHQAGVRFAIPLLLQVATGCPIPMSSATWAPDSIGSHGTASDPRCSRDPSYAGAMVQNLAIPGAKVGDISTQFNNPLRTLFLGGSTELDRAMEAQPTFVSVFIGNNDILVPAITGTTAGITSVADFQTAFDKMNPLFTMSTVKGGILFGVVNPAYAPIMIPAAYLFPNALPGYPGYAVYADAALNGGTPSGKVQIHPSCGTSAATAVDAHLNTVGVLGMLKAQMSQNPAGPWYIPCVDLGAAYGNLGAQYVLDTAETRVVNTTAAGYNNYIKSRAQALGWIYIDPNLALGALQQAGVILPVPNFANKAAPFGAGMSLDGLHPALPTQQAIANTMIDSVNVHYGTSIPKISGAPGALIAAY